MSAPTLAAEPMMTLHVTLRAVPLGRTPWGEREEVWFEGTAMSPHWEGERAVTGIDHIVVAENGAARIDVHTVITGGDETISYRGSGRAGNTGLFEGVIFETSSERLGWLNEAVAVGRGTIEGDRLTVELFLIG